MLSKAEIKQFIDEDNASLKKKAARKGQDYYEGRHDIKDYRMFYYNGEGNLVEDKYRSNIKISHPFFTELVDQATQYMLSGKDGFVKSDMPELQTELDKYFNENQDFIAELSEVITGGQAKGFEYMYAYRKEDNTLTFQCADCIGVIEVEARFTEKKKDHVIYWYIDRIDKEGKKVKKIIVFDDEYKYYYTQTDEGEIEDDKCFNGTNIEPHTVYEIEGDNQTYQEGFGFIPFFRFDNNKKQTSSLNTVKELIDDYDLMASSLSNNLVDFDTPIHVVKGFEGDNVDELQKNIKTKKIVAFESEEAGAGVDIKTVDVPYQARVAKLELDEKNVYKFGMGLNTSGLKDTAATTSVAIKAAYSLLDLKCSKLTIKLQQFLWKIVKVVLDDINKESGTAYQTKDVYFNFEHEIMSNEEENARIKLTEAQVRQTEINTLMNIAAKIGDELLMQLICEQLDIDYDDIKDKLPNPDEAEDAIQDAQTALDGVSVIEGGTVE